MDIRSIVLAGLLVASASPLFAATLIAQWEGKTLLLASEPTDIVLRLSEDVSLALLKKARARRFTLVLEGTAAESDPGTGYLVFLNLAENAKPAADDIGYLGSISFFGAPKLPPTHSDQRGRTISFDISQALDRLDRAGQLNGPLSVTIVPAGPPAKGSRPSVENIILYEN